MKLHELLSDQDQQPESLSTADIEITGLTLDSQEIKPGELFIALKGLKRDGRAFIQDAIHKGASAVLYEAQDLAEFSYSTPTKIPVIPIKNLGSRLHDLADNYYDEPSKKIGVIGITGTNGKTTTAYVLAQALSRLGILSGVLGTIGYGLVHQLKNSALTTPNAVDLQKYLKDLKDNGAKAVAMEVSSHGLEQNRVKNIHFESAMFTNLTQDHLDYHLSMQAYGKAKQKLFQFPSLKRAIVNADSDFSKNIIQVCRQDLPIVLYSLGQQHLSSGFSRRSSLFFINLEQFSLDDKGIKATIDSSWGKEVLRSPLLGEFNLSNLLGVLGELCLRNIPLKDAVHALQHVSAAPGRMQRLGGASNPQIIVDYAHTPDALENALKAARHHCRRRLWCVFGCGGDRDKDKRPKMGHIAGLFADKIVVTSDNPRGEDPRKIIEDVIQGIAIEHSDKVTIEEDRSQAIEYAINNALPVDTILIAGKGHESYQLIADKKLPFNDVEYVKTILEDGNNEVVSDSK
jgi:UDP-N-acetylmuramoyl-L-alanyl-D-glutamate--2,6-diaminopimelate ligase